MSADFKVFLTRMKLLVIHFEYDQFNHKGHKDDIEEEKLALCESHVFFSNTVLGKY